MAHVLDWSGTSGVTVSTKLMLRGMLRSDSILHPEVPQALRLQAILMGVPAPRQPEACAQ